MSHRTFNLHRLHGCSSTASLLIKEPQSWSQKCQNSNSVPPLTPEFVLSKSNRDRCMCLLSSSKTTYSRVDKSSKKAAVLVPLCTVNDQLALLYTVRALHLKVNGGQVAFPGGMFDESDGSLEHTALREAHEEIGLPTSQVDVWGKTPVVNRRDVCVTPFLGYVGHVNPEKLQINLGEVSCAFSMSLEDLCSIQNFRYTTFRFHNKIYQTPVFTGGRERIWGLTAYITHFVLSALVPEHYKKNIEFRPLILKMLEKC